MRAGVSLSVEKKLDIVNAMQCKNTISSIQPHRRENDLKFLARTLHPVWVLSFILKLSLFYTSTGFGRQTFQPAFLFALNFWQSAFYKFIQNQSRSPQPQSKNQFLASYALSTPKVSEPVTLHAADMPCLRPLNHQITQKNCR